MRNDPPEGAEPALDGVGSVSVAEEGAQDALDVLGCHRVDGTEPMDEASAADRTNELALHVARVIEPGRIGRLHPHVEGQSPPCGGERADDHEREVDAERVGWSDDQGRSVMSGFAGERVTEVDEPQLVR